MTYKLTHLNKKEIVQHRNNLLPYYQKEYALRELDQLYSFTGLKVIQNNSDFEQNQSINMNPIQKPLDNNKRELPKQTSKNLDNKKITQTERKTRKLKEKILPQDQNEKSATQRLQNIYPTAKILKKVDFQKPL